MDGWVSVCLAARVVRDAQLVGLRYRREDNAVMSNRCWHGGFANGGQEGGQAVGADAGEPCLVRRGGDGDDAESADDGCWRWVGVGSGDLRSCGPHGEQGEWELMHINASRTETLASRLRPLGAWIPGKNDDGEH